ncbi:hypothetical protein SAMN04487943_101321 [Gracilibacillus orientalis]|uniref:Uncharacterized protein n=1 Tax=Gracilibacillus orientalis TaxID=334253 RepID=A0A1I4HAN5_9BACI|nr:hypothetical protein [Gracilibacillus orientalis]SFL39274.1 hypothetical protein SAMN04487943_101321 [Gracilibacillus orientalis]
MTKYEKTKQFYLDIKKSNSKVIAKDAVTHHMANLITRVTELERKMNK